MRGAELQTAPDYLIVHGLSLGHDAADRVEEGRDASFKRGETDDGDQPEQDAVFDCSCTRPVCATRREGLCARPECESRMSPA